jgi:general stress protein YciG
VAKEDRGFASMDRAKQREIASKGGKAAHQKGTAHEWTSEEARDAGRKGGIASHQRRREQSSPAVPESEVALDRSSSSSPGSSTSDRESWSPERPSTSEPQMPIDRDEE